MPGEQLKLIDEEHREADFGGRRLDWLVIARSTFDRCRFNGLRAKETSLGGGGAPSVFRDCTFDGVQITLPTLLLLRFERCTFRDAVMRKWITNDVEFVDCVFGGDFRELTVAGTGERPNEITGNDFRDALMLGGGFRAGVDLGRQQLPSDPRHILISDPATTLPAAYAAVREWPDRDQQLDARSTLNVLYQDFRGGQRQLLLCAGRRSGPEPANERLRDLIRQLVAGR